MTVYDKRDETQYTVRKLADGNCWMTENLALDLTALSQSQLYGTGADAGKMTNASDTTLGYLKNGGGTVSNKYANTALSKAWTLSSDSYSAPRIAVDSTTSGPCLNAYCVNGGSAGSPWSYSDSTSVTINDLTSVVQGKIGVYYNYCAASAGSYCWGNGTNSGSSAGNTGYFWTKSRYNDETMRNFNVTSTSVSASSSNRGRMIGCSIRCVRTS